MPERDRRSPDRPDGKINTGRVNDYYFIGVGGAGDALNSCVAMAGGEAARYLFLKSPKFATELPRREDQGCSEVTWKSSGNMTAENLPLPKSLLLG